MELINKIVQALYDKKAVNVIVIDVHAFSSVTNYFLIAEGNVERHVKALAFEVCHVIKENGEQVIYMDGEQESNWMVVDQGEVVVHIMTEEMRDRYRLEELFSEGKIVPIDEAALGRGNE